MRRKDIATVNVRAWERRNFWRKGMIVDVEVWHAGRLLPRPPRKLPTLTTDTDYCATHRARMAQSLLRAAPRPSLWPHLAICGLIALAVVMLAATTRAYLQGAMSYVDNGDGYYLYAAQRLAHGAVLYRDVMGTQPPLVYALGAAVFKLGGALTTVRLVSAALRALSIVLVFLAGRRLFGNRLTAGLAALPSPRAPIGPGW